MNRRTDFHDILVGILGSPNVYFQPPSGFMMEYPCIVYNINDEKDDFADNIKYRNFTRYLVTVIDADPDSEIPARLSVIPYSLFNRRFPVNNLNHTAYNIYF